MTLHAPVDDRSRSRRFRGTVDDMIPRPETPPPDRPVIRSQTDLERAWRTLMEPLGFSTRTMWVMFVDPDDRPFPQLLEVSDLPARPTAEDEEAVAAFLHHLPVAPGSGARLAFLLCRPGRDGVGAADRAWAASVYDACRAADVPCEVVHLATDVSLVPIPMDDLPLPASA